MDTAVVPDPPPPVLYRGEFAGGELLLTVYPDGMHEIAFRADQWETWYPPVRLHPVPAVTA